MRPREFEQDEVMRVAFESFWRKGVRGTSLSDIARDTGVPRGSLYNAFGSKEALFLQAYEHYAAEYIRSAEQALSGRTLRQCLANFFKFAIANFRKGSPPRGCPTTRGLMELSSIAGQGLDDTARKAFAGLLNRLIALIESTLDAARARGEFKGDVRKTALHIVTIARGLVVLERAFGDEAQLHEIARHTIDMVVSNA